jgi:branched-chain amino acid transport system ATP-binding protein
MTSGDATVPPRGDALELRGVTAGYGRTTVLRNVDLTVPPGKVVALLGPNGAGKTTLLRVASGLLSPMTGEVVIGDVAMTRRRPFERARAGLCLVPEGRGIFPNLTVRENLLLQVPPWAKQRDIDPAAEAFPLLKDRLGQTAGSMSGGQQQMLALARCFLASPSVVLLDEVSMGLAPRVIEQIFDALALLAERGVALLLVEQYVSRALEVADKVYLLNRGAVAFCGSPSELDEEELISRYLGTESPKDHPDGSVPSARSVM